MERVLALLGAFVMGLVAFAVALFLAIAGSLKIGISDGLGMIFSLALGLATLVFTLWKAPRKIRNGLDGLRAKSPEPLYSCLATGLTCALAIGALMAVPIFLLGHTRPEGWDLDRIPPFVLGAFIFGVMIGLPLGRERSRERRSQRKAVTQ